MSASESRPVIAVIPHYNMPETLTPLIQQAVDQRYDDIYVLDDHSTNCDVEKVTKPFGSKVTLIAGQENRGAGGNRNRILEVDQQALGGSVLHFIDADCELLTDDIPAKICRIFKDERIGTVGGLVLNADNSIYPYNYNPRISLNWIFAANLQAVMSSIRSRSPSRADSLYHLFEKVLVGFPDLGEAPLPRKVFCVTEANMMIPYDTFKAVGGFDARLKYHEAQDLAHKIAGLDLSERWEPSIAVKHHAVQVRGRSRMIENMRSAYTVARKYGLTLH